MLILLDVVSLTAQQKQSLSSANLPTSVSDMSETSHMSVQINKSGK